MHGVEDTLSCPSCTRSSNSEMGAFPFDFAQSQDDGVRRGWMAAYSETYDGGRQKVVEGIGARVGYSCGVRVAVVHHWFVTRGGGERVAECIASLFPQAEIFTLVAGPAGI